MLGVRYLEALPVDFWTGDASLFAVECRAHFNHYLQEGTGLFSESPSNPHLALICESCDCFEKTSPQKVLEDIAAWSKRPGGVRRVTLVCSNLEVYARAQQVLQNLTSERPS